MTTENEAIGRRIENQRRALGMSQTALAEALRMEGLGFHQQTVARVESGTRPLRAIEVAPVCEALGIPVSALLDLASSPPRPCAVCATVADELRSISDRLGAGR